MTIPTARRLAILASCLGGTAFLAGQFVMREIEPFTFCTLRFFLSSAALLLISRLRGSRITTSVIKASLLPGISLASAMLLLFFALRTSVSGVASFFANSDSFLIPVVGLLFFGKKTTTQTIVALIIGASGLALLTIRADFSIRHEEMMMAISAVCFAFYFCSSGKAVEKEDPILITAFSQLLGGIYCSIFAVTHDTPLHLPPPGAILGLLYFAFVLGAAAFALRAAILRVISPSELGVFFLAEPCVAVLLGYTLNDERLTLQQGIGLAVIFVALVIPNAKFILTPRPAATISG